MGGKEWTERLLAREPTVVDIDAIIAEKASEKYWDDFATELSASPPRFERLITLLVEIRERLMRLVPNRTDLHDKLKAELDLDLLKQMIEHGVFDYQAFVSTFDSIWSNIAALQAAEDDQEWKAWKEEVQQRFIASSAEPSSSWSMLLPPLFNRILCQLDKLEDKVAAARAALAEHQKKNPSPQ